MYASVTAQHQPMDKEINISHSVVGVSVHLSQTIYLSFKPDEAMRLGNALIEASIQHGFWEKARAAEAKDEELARLKKAADEMGIELS